MSLQEDLLTEYCRCRKRCRCCRAMDIDQDPTRETLYRRLPRAALGAEFGVWRGDNAAALLRVARPRQLCLVDPWPKQMRWGGCFAGDGDEFYAEVSTRFSSEIDAGQVRLFRQPALEFAARWQDGSVEARFSEAKEPLFVTGYAGHFDWIYVDCEHQRTWQHLDALVQLVRPGGLLGVHDYVAKPRRGWDVVPAVDRLVASGRARWIARTHEAFPTALLRRVV